MAIVKNGQWLEGLASLSSFEASSSDGIPDFLSKQILKPLVAILTASPFLFLLFDLATAGLIGGLEGLLAIRLYGRRSDYSLKQRKRGLLASPEELKKIKGGPAVISTGTTPTQVGGVEWRDPTRVSTYEIPRQAPYTTICCCAGQARDDKKRINYSSLSLVSQARPKRKRSACNREQSVE